MSKGLWIAGILVVLIGGIGGFLWSRRGPSADAVLEGEIAAAKKDGMPMTAEGLAPPIPDSEDAGPIYEPALLTIHQAFKDHPNLVAEVSRAQKDQASDGDWKDIRDALSQVGKSVSQIVMARNRKGWNIGFSYDGYDFKLPEAVYCKRAASLMSVDAQLLGDAGKYDEAFEMLLGVDAMARHLAETRTLITALIQDACDRYVMEAFLHLLSGCSRKPQMLEKAQKALDAMRGKADVASAIEGELVMSLNFYKHLRTTGDVKALDTKNVGQKGQGQPLTDDQLKRLKAELIWSWRSAYQAAHDNASDWKAEYAAMQSYEDAVQQRIKLDHSPDHDLLALVHPTGDGSKLFSEMVFALGEPIAHRRMAAAAIHVLSERLKTGKLPESLPTDAIDPYDGKPLRYKRDGNGFMIYSVGRDSKDNGGGKGDLVARFK